MTVDVQWEASQLAALLTTYIGGIEDVVKPVMVRSVSHLISEVGDVYATIGPIVGRALAESDVNIPGEPYDADA